jgi:hypothetical protein
VVVSIGSIARAIGLAPKHEVRDRDIRGLEKEFLSANQSNNTLMPAVSGTDMSKQSDSRRALKEVSLSEVLAKANYLLVIAKAEGASGHKVNALKEVISDAKDAIKIIPALKEVLDREIRAEMNESNDPLARAIDTLRD